MQSQSIIWQEKMNTTSAVWTGDTILILDDDVNCPNPYTFCWSFNSSSNASRVDSTEGFDNIQLTYSVAASGSDGGDICIIEYSTNGTMFYDVERLMVNYQYIAFTNIFTANDFNHSADNIYGLTVRLSYIGSGHNCYFNEFKLEGTAITAAPTSDPTIVPTYDPTIAPSIAPTSNPTIAPTKSPSNAPSRSPSKSPSDLPTLSPTPSPTYSAPLITDNCRNESFRRCYYVDIAPIPDAVETRTISIQQEYLGYFSQYYEIYVTPRGFDCRYPSISLDYEPIDNDYLSEYLQLFMSSNTSILTCGGVLDQCNVSTSCLFDYKIGINTLEVNQERLLLTIIKSEEVHASCKHHNYAINAQLTIICSDETSTPTMNPASITTAQMSSNPVTMFIISNIYYNTHNYSLILMTKNYDYISLYALDVFVGSSIDIISITELTDYSHCTHNICIQFFSVLYIAQCQSVLNGGSGLVLNGKWNAQFETNCTNDEDMNRIQCLDKLKQINNDSNILTVQNSNAFEFADELCIDALYSYTFTVDINYYNSNFSSERKEFSAKYREGDTVYIEMDISTHNETYIVSSITIHYVFGCTEASAVLSQAETQTGIGGCLLAESQYDVDSGSNNGGRLWFKIPDGVQTEHNSKVFNVQIQTILSVSRVLSSTPISDQVRHFMINVALYDVTETKTAAANAIVIIVVFVCLAIVVAVNVINKRKHNKNKENIAEPHDPNEHNALDPDDEKKENIEPHDQNEQNEYADDDEKKENIPTEECKETSERTDIVCGLCGYVSMEQEPIFTMKPCDHILHLQCAKDWMKGSDNCPQCYDPISNKETFL